MRRGHGARPPIPTKKDLEETIAGDREIVACSGLRYGPLTALTMCLHNGGAAMVCLNDIGSMVLLEALRALFQTANQQAQLA
jgi:hypothetical protein